MFAVFLSSNSKLLFRENNTKNPCERQFASANILKGLSLVRLTGKRSSAAFC